MSYLPNQEIAFWKRTVITCTTPTIENLMDEDRMQSLPCQAIISDHWQDQQYGEATISF
jgi:hypothetical protein